MEIPTLAGRDHDYGFYVQDNWKPNERLTLNLGIRADFVRRYDSLFDVERMNSVGVGPRLGVSYLVPVQKHHNLWCARDLSKMWVLYVFGRGFVGLRANENLGRNERRIVSNPWL